MIESAMTKPARLALVKKADLTPVQLEHLRNRLADPMHVNDGGPPNVWNGYTHGVFAFVECNSGLPIAIAEASGLDWVAPGWWVDYAFRQKGYGKELVDLLADYLKSIGVKRIGKIRIQTYRGEFDIWSEKLADRMRAHFPGAE